MDRFRTFVEQTENRTFDVGRVIQTLKHAIPAALMSSVVAITPVEGAPNASTTHVHPEVPTRFQDKFKGKLVTIEVAVDSNDPNDLGKIRKICNQQLDLYSKKYGGEDYRYPNEPYYQTMKGCSIGGLPDNKKLCVVVYQAGKPHVLRHEIGHCGGWPGDHPL